jgi:hypothetical protein
MFWSDYLLSPLVLTLDERREGGGITARERIVSLPSAPLSIRNQGALNPCRKP